MLFRLFFALFVLLYSLVASAQEVGVPKSYGAIQAWSYDQSRHELRLRGWSLGGLDGRQPPELLLNVGGGTYRSGGPYLEWTQRADLPPDHPLTGGQAGAGFDWLVKLKDPLAAGVHPLQLTATFPNGHRAAIKGSETDTPVVVVQEIKRRHWRVLALILLGIAAIGYAQRRWRNGGAAWQRHWLAGHRMAWGMGALFVVLVTVGVTGSSMGVLFNSPYGKSILDVQGASRTVLGDEWVRGDEWGVQLPNILAQLQHEPRFPVVNELLGQDGQNMGVIGMTGVPVRQWAALARPATWGFFVLPLRQAMAWHWQLPFWGCLLALWLMLNVLRPTQRGLNLALSLAFCVAPYAAAWSNWPLYATMFPAFAFVVVAAMLRSEGVGKGVALGAVLGWLLACWALVLYPTWIIVVGSSMAFIGLGWCVDNRMSLRFGKAQWAGLTACTVVLLILLGSWWMDTHEAIALMRATVYPGGRGAMPGGELSWWWHLRGYHGLESLRSTGPDSNPSEASSYLILPLLMLALVALSLVRDRQMRWTVLGCMAFMGCFWIYTMVGIPVELARITLWGNMPPGRMDVGFGFLMAVILCVCASSVKVPVTIAGRAAALTVAALSAGLVVMALLHTPLTIAPNVSTPVLMASMAVPVAFICGWALWGRIGSSVALMVWIFVIATLQFNPLRIAPSSVELAQGHRSFVADAQGRSQRTLVLNGDGIGAMIFAAVGVPIANGVFYYPHRALWQGMHLSADEWSQVNRYQHLGFYLMDDVDAERGYRLALPSVDQLHVHVHPQRFDFSCTGALRVAAPAQLASMLVDNPGLTQLGIYRDVAWFAVQSSCPKSPADVE